MATKGYIERYVERYVERLQLRRERAEFQVNEVRKLHDVKVHDAKLAVENLAARHATATGAEYEQIGLELNRARENYDARSHELDLEVRKALRVVEDIDHDMKEARSAPGKFLRLVFVLIIIEVLVLYLVHEYGEGANLLQQITHSLSLFPAAFTLWLVLSYLWLGLQGIRALGWPILKLLKEETPGDSG